MTADDITIDRLADLQTVLAIADKTVWRLQLSAHCGSIDPAEAAAILTETLANINAAFR